MTKVEKSSVVKVESKENAYLKTQETAPSVEVESKEDANITGQEATVIIERVDAVERIATLTKWGLIGTLVLAIVLFFVNLLLQHYKVI